MTDEPKAPSRAARIALYLAVAWLLAGALFKLLAGSPNDLPEMIREFPLLKPTWTFRLAIGVELSIVLIALVRPRVGWILIVLMFAFFDFLLYKLGAAGEKSCGCFGSAAPKWLTPFVMMCVDSALLLGVLVTRPWSRFSTGSRKVKILLPVVALLMGMPWLPFFFEEAGHTTVINEETGEEEEIVTGDFHQFVPTEWEGQVIVDTDLAEWIDGGADLTYGIPAPAHVVVYRESCDHCRAHFEELMANPPEVAIALIRIPEREGGDNVVDDVKPPQTAIELSLVELPKGYGITTPVTFELTEDWTVKDVVQGGDEDEGH